MRTRHLTAISAACVAAVTVLVPALPAEAASAVRIYRVWYDSPGKDTRSNASLNAEWVQIKNYGKAGRSLKGWKLKDKTGYTYTFGKFTLAGGKTVKVRTGRGANTRANLYWGRRAYVWNNTGDTAYLRYPSGKLADSCTFDGQHDSKYC